MRTTFAMVTLCLLAAGVLALAEERKEPPANPAYRIELLVKDGGDATAKNSRRFVIETELNGKGSLRLGARVPYATSAPATQYAYADVGVNIDCRLREVAKQLLLYADVEISSVAPPAKGVAAPVATPTIAQVKVSASTAVTLGQPRVIAVIDDPSVQRKLEVEATVTPVK